ncbi:MAG: tRNA methyltransferase [Cenarchaeum symbiont of Oopsacas minuta]|nr:tRNA methyltransferase [Cenarchaeum symbiont of Oopsacas minuta]
MVIEVLRIGERVVRDDRATTHVALVARAFGAMRIYMSGIGAGVEESIDKVNKRWGGMFAVEVIESWKKIAREKKRSGFKIVHLTMYGQNVDDIAPEIREYSDILVIIGAEKVPREVYDMADYNVAVGNQPHSEISALAILLDRLGAGFSREQHGAHMKIIPQKRGKMVLYDGVEKSANC